MIRVGVIALALCYLLQSALHAAEPRFSAGGRLNLDAIYTTQLAAGATNTNVADIAFIPSSIPVDGTGTESRFSINHRESRFWGTLHLPLGERDLSTYVEVDLMGTRNTARGDRLSAVPRLRHYHLKYGGLVLGQTNTGFFNVSSFPEVNDFNGPVGAVVVRQELVSYTHRFDWASASLSLEDSQSNLVTGSGQRLVPEDERYPDAVLKLVFNGDWGNVSVSGLLREITHKNVSRESLWAGGINVSGRVLFANNDNLRFTAAWGEGIGRYISFGTFSDALLDNSGELQPVQVASLNLAYQHWWTGKLRSNLVLGTTHADHPAGVNPAMTDSAFYSSHLNLLWSPRLDITLGVEWLYGRRERKDGADGELNRLQVSARYRF